jgi:iron complex outermembrane recepter protein
LNLIEVILAQESLNGLASFMGVRWLRHRYEPAADLSWNLLKEITMTRFLKQKHPFARIQIAHSAIFLVAISAAQSARAQAAPAASEATLPAITVTTPRARERSEISGFGDVPLREAPFSSTVIDSAIMQSLGASRLRDLQPLDASISDAYNAVGYIDYATVRGYVINNTYNFRRDGLPINGNTAIGLTNKDRVEIFKGTSGLQAGVSSPGGLVNYVTKRPSAKPVREVSLRMNSEGAFGASFDIGTRFGQGNAQGLRLNAAFDRLNDAAPATKGRSHQIALAFDTRIGQTGLLEAEIEHNRQSQPNVPGLSILGSANQLPSPDPKLNLNQQSWTQPTVFNNSFGSLRFSQDINEQWRWSAHAGAQRSRTDDRVAFPLGCDAEGIYDRFCSNGDVDLYDFRSEGERRRVNALQLKLMGRLETGAVKHDLSVGLLRASASDALPPSAFNGAGTINLATPTAALAPASATSGGSERIEKSTELSINDVISWTPSLKTWLGLRHVRLARDDRAGTTYTQSFNTPWAALSYTQGAVTLYASHGHGIESVVVPNIPAQYGAQANQALPALRSRQTEIGIKGQQRTSSNTLDWSVAAFDIRQPLVDEGASAYTIDGTQRHRGLEASIQGSFRPWTWGGSLTVLNARQQGRSAQPALNGLKPTNVPSHILRLNAAYAFAPSWQIGAHLSRQGARAVLPDNSVSIPAWTRIDASLRHDTTVAGQATSFVLGIDNLLNKRYFKESPYQFGHSYLFPASARTFRLGVSVSL